MLVLPIIFNSCQGSKKFALSNIAAKNGIGGENDCFERCSLDCAVLQHDIEISWKMNPLTKCEGHQCFPEECINVLKCLMNCFLGHLSQFHSSLPDAIIDSVLVVISVMKNVVISFSPKVRTSLNKVGQ